MRRTATFVVSVLFVLSSPKAGPPLTGWLSVSLLGVAGDLDVFLRVIRNTRDPRMTPPGGFRTLAPSP